MASVYDMEVRVKPVLVSGALGTISSEIEKRVSAATGTATPETKKSVQSFSSILNSASSKIAKSAGEFVKSTAAAAGAGTAGAAAAGAMAGASVIALLDEAIGKIMDTGIGDLLNLIATAIEMLIDMTLPFLRILGPIANILTAMYDLWVGAVTGPLTAIVNGILKGFALVGKILTMIFKPIEIIAFMAIMPLVFFLLPFIRMMNLLLRPFMLAYMAYIKKMAPSLMSGNAGGIGAVFGVLAGAIGEGLKAEAGYLFGTMLAPLGDILVDVLKTVGKYLIEPIQTALAGIMTSLSGMANLMGIFVDSIGVGIVKSIYALGTILSDLIGNLGKQLIDRLEFLKTLISIIKTVIAGVMVQAGLGGVYKTFIAPMFEGLTAGVNMVEGQVASSFDAIQDTVTSTFTYLGDTTASAFNSLTNYVANFGGYIETLGGTLNESLSNVKNTWESYLSEISTSTTSFYSTIESSMSASFSTLTDMATRFGSAVSSAAVGGAGAVTGGATATGGGTLGQYNAYTIHGAPGYNEALMETIKQIKLQYPGSSVAENFIGGAEGRFNYYLKRRDSQGNPLPDMFLGWSPTALPYFEQGGTMPHTGLAYLHQGETVIPANKGGMGGSVNINMNVKVSGDYDVRKAVENLQREMQIQLRRANASGYYG